MTVGAQTNDLGDRALWASINGKKDASLGDYQQHTGKVLVSWRMLPGDNADTGFDLYRAIGTATEKKIASNIKNRTCYHLGSDLKNDAEAWAEAEKVQNLKITTAVNTVIAHTIPDDSRIYNLSGQRVDTSYKGIIIKNGKKRYTIK